MNIIGLRVWYGDGTYRETAIAQPVNVQVVAQSISGWPRKDLQLIQLFFDVEWTPGKWARENLMGNDTYWYDPNADQTNSLQCWGKSNETPQQVRARLGSQVVTYEGKWMTDAGFQAVIDAAMAMQERPV